MTRFFTSRLALAAVLLVSLAAGEGRADIVAQGSTIFNEPNGFYTGVKTYTVYTDDDAANPAPGAPGEYTYVYTIANDAGSFFSLIRYQVLTPPNQVSSASFIDDAGNPTPSGVNVDNPNGQVTFDWSGSDLIDPGDVSDRLVIVSPYSPGLDTETMVGVGDEASFDTQFTCVGPFVPPVMEGPPEPCTIGFWKNRAAGKNGLLQFFPDPDFDTVVSAAVALSGGVFADEAALLADLQSKGHREIVVRARQQLAAVLLDLAAADLFPENQKCKLFDGNWITTNACGDDLSIGEAVTQLLSDVTSGDPALEHTTMECADDINNGISVSESP
jgi:hypothetical protein